MAGGAGGDWGLRTSAAARSALGAARFSCGSERAALPDRLRPQTCRRRLVNTRGRY